MSQFGPGTHPVHILLDLRKLGMIGSNNGCFNVLKEWVGVNKNHTHAHTHTHTHTHLGQPTISGSNGSPFSKSWGAAPRPFDLKNAVPSYRVYREVTWLSPDNHVTNTSYFSPLIVRSSILENLLYHLHTKVVQCITHSCHGDILLCNQLKMKLKWIKFHNSISSH